MERRRLGQGLEVRAIGLGCMNLNLNYSGAPVSEADASRLLRRAYELGVDFFDTARLYRDNEVLVGRALRDVRDKVVIATKFGLEAPADIGAVANSERRAALRVNSRPDYIRKVCDESLRRLGVEVIDLLYQHRVDPHVPIEDVAGTVGDLVREGKVRWFGLSEAGAETIRRAHRTHPLAALQTEYSLSSRQVERKILPTCRELGVGFVAYSPLGRGLLSGSGLNMGAGDFRTVTPRFKGEALTRNMSLYAAFAEIAAAKGCTPAQLAIAWVLHQGPEIVPIPGTAKIHQLEENLAAAGVRLSSEDLAAIDAAIPASAVLGARYDPAGAAMVEG